ncbi:transglycosylase domain-containing protein [Oceanicola sp. 22II-s10i]|uniref:transglycosylase domain-containing protein n=1 Tax=Oceanicola sp. 22II-s10i TaxID=1317116 RepID=UPI000B51F5AE|nr:transglycosylase domain-containing protein [Oceanicola sp. 22II-s10i]
MSDQISPTDEQSQGQPSETYNTERSPRSSRPRRRWIFLGALGVVMASAIGAGAWVGTRPDLSHVRANAKSDLYYEDAKGDSLKLALGRTATYVPLAEMPAELTDAVIALEDRRFRKHGGVDFRSIARAFGRNLTSGGIVEGGSTITQQLIKISFLDPARTYSRKIHEAMLARELEATHSKDEILEAYLNKVYLGSGAHGVGAGARTYFDKAVSELTLAESAVLAATIRTPSGLNPFSNPEPLLDRARMVIDLMEGQGRIEAGAANDARLDLATLRFHRSAPTYGGWFADWVAPHADGLATRLRGPVTMRTTLDPDLQRRAEAAIADGLAGTSMQGALVALRPDGTIAAMVGGRNYNESQFNRATDAIRQPGSTFKTVVYLTALADGMTPETRISDDPIDINGYEPENFSGRNHGTVTLAEAFSESMNVATVRLAAELGFDRVAEAARALGVEAEMSETPSIGLGANGMSLLDLTEMYAAIATGRAPFDARGISGITRPGGEYTPVDWREPRPSALAQHLMMARRPMAAMLRLAVTHGTGKAVAEVPRAVGKTGTSQNNRDALFVGWAENMIVGVWVGNDDNSPMDGVTGGSIPAEIWAAFMTNRKAAPIRTEEDAPEPQIIAVSESRNLDERDIVSAEEAGRTRNPESPEEKLRVAQEIIDNAGPEGITVNQLAKRLSERLMSRGERTAQSCNVEVCARFYRSFRASDCTFQPYGNRPREICTR